MEYERCIDCDELTDRAGQFDDSLYLDDNYGPLCTDCHSVLDTSGYTKQLQQHIKELEAKLNIAISNWTRCYTAYDIQVDNMSYKESIKNLREEEDYQKAQKALEKK